MQFPNVSGVDLMRHRVVLPEDLGGDLNLLLVAFQQWHQELVNTWIPFAEELERTRDGVRYYELPTIQSLNVLSRTFINEGMRAGIRDQDTRARTITLYLDKTAFRSALEMDNEDTIYALLLDGSGQVLWKAQGEFTPEKGAALLSAIPGEGI